MSAIGDIESSRKYNWFKERYDNGAYIRNEDDYLQLFKNQHYDCKVVKKFRKCLLYNEIFFSADPIKPVQREEVIYLTVAYQVKICVASLKSAQASLEQFALETQN